MTNVRCSKPKTECLSTVDSKTWGPANCGQCKKLLKLGRGAQVFISSILCEPTKLLGGLYQQADLGLMKKRMTNIHEKRHIKNVFPETINLLYRKTFSILSLPWVINDVALDGYENQMRKCFKVCCTIVSWCYYFYYISYLKNIVWMNVLNTFK